MAQWRKRLEEMAQNPGGVRFEELDALLRRAGFQRRQPRSGSSHYVYTKGPHRLTVPYRTPYLKPIYVRLALRILKGESLDDDKGS